MTTQLLLFSNSRSSDGSYLTHALAPLRALAGERRNTLFVPFAGVTASWDDYTAKVRESLAPLGLALTGAHTVDAGTADRYDLIVVGGGNTFQLVAECRRRGWLHAIPERVRAGTPYSGWSAGANLACPTLCTTNDMPIVDPGGFDALGLIGFQINPHYTNALPPGHQGETRNDRIAEFLVANPAATVVGLPEGDWLAGDGRNMTFHGPHTGYIFRQGEPPAELREGMAVA
ncbi:dipeptidase PepE [Bordetella bronchialis]|uniref:Dipeptidase E n=1 Tax=Bordetella bronchialis TaxID=463025 RepID=A0A193FZS2_9BORD|nr:dipeptidase PepE [Bordetella bronchialis]ANN73120.1 dipeptidase E [Bordetella bronchialis]